MTKGSDTLESFLSKVAFESNLRKKLSRIEHVLRKRLLKENFLVCHYLKPCFSFMFILLFSIFGFISRRLLLLC